METTTATTVRGTILRFALGDCTNGGVSSQAKRVKCVVGEDDAPGAVLRIVPWYGYFKAVPVARPDGMVGPMMGGNYIALSGSTAARDFPHPVPVHDRFETPEGHAALCT